MYAIKLESVFGYISLRRPILLHSWHFYHIVCNQGTQLTAVVRSGKAVVVTGGNGVGDKALTVMNAAGALSLTYDNQTTSISTCKVMLSVQISDQIGKSIPLKTNQ